MKHLKKNNIDLIISDFSLETGITTVAALAVDQNTFPETSEIVYTAGTTPGPEKAIIRAVTEVAQLGGDFNSGSNYVASGLPKPGSLAEVEYVTKSPLKTCVSEMEDISDDNIKVELERCIDALRRKDRHVFMIDVAHPDLEIPAFYTIIPGTHFRERSARKDAGLFAAKLLYQNVTDPVFFERKLKEMESIVKDPYYLFFYRGISFFNNGEYEKGLFAFNNALAKNPEKEDLPYIFSYKGHCLKDLERYGDAIETLELGIAEDEERPDIHNLLGFCWFKQQKYERAIKHFERAVELNPSSAMDYANLGVNHSRIGNKDDAVHYFTVALTLDPSLDFVREQLDKLINL